MEFLNPLILILIPFLLFFINKKNILLVFSGIFVVLALSQIVTIEKKQIKIPNNDIYIAIDNSWSMACKDLKPNRLERTKQQIKKFILDTNYNIALLTFNKNITLLNFPTQSEYTLLENLKKIELHKSSTDIEMVINSINGINFEPKTIIIVSDGGDKKIDKNFIFWGFATKKGAKVPEFDGISKLNIIGNYFDNEKEIIKYINSHLTFKIKEVDSYKNYSLYFAFIALLLLTLNTLKEKFFIFLIVLYFPHQSYANDSLGCFYNLFGFEDLAIKEFKQTNSNFSNMKVGIYYLKKHNCYKAIQYFKKVKHYNKEKNFNIALCLIYENEYHKAFGIMEKLHQTYEDDIIYFYYKILNTYLHQDITIVYPITNPLTIKNSNSKNKNSIHLKKDNPW